MSQRTMTHIVPALPPLIDGIGDYALNLARHLRERHDVNSRFIVCDPEWQGPARIEDFPVRRLRLRNEACIWMLLASIREHSTVLLHYVGYGYHKRGVPLWLHRGIKSWLKEPAGGRLLGRKQFSTVFHELWASGTPWQSAFYLQPVQRWLIEEFHRWSVVSITSTRRMQAALEGISPRKTICLPIPSNMPTVATHDVVPRSSQRLRVAIFGQPWSRAATVKAHTNLLRALEVTNRLDCAMVIGKGLSKSSTEDVTLLRQCVSPRRVQILGELPAAGVSCVLSDADLFISHYRAELACKSGALMAALAVGCPAVLTDGRNAAPLHENEHFIASDDSDPCVNHLTRTLTRNELARIAGQARHWYREHADWSVIARRYQEIFCPGARSGAPELSKEVVPA